MQIHLGCSFVYRLPERTPMVFIVRPCAYDRHQLLEEIRMVTPDVPIADYSDPFGNRVWRLVAPAGTLRCITTPSPSCRPRLT